MQYVKPLIDKASEVCGSDSKLAERMGVHRVVIAEMRSGKRSISPATAAELADIAGEDAREAAIAAILEGAKGTRREGVLRDIASRWRGGDVGYFLQRRLEFCYGKDSNE